MVLQGYAQSLISRGRIKSKKGLQSCILWRLYGCTVWNGKKGMSQSHGIQRKESESESSLLFVEPEAVENLPKN